MSNYNINPLRRGVNNFFENLTNSTNPIYIQPNQSIQTGGNNQQSVPLTFYPSMYPPMYPSMYPSMYPLMYPSNSFGTTIQK